jgi:murein DD-endopeptidase MepM/ murein hydrolase activator NlpD
MRIHGLALASGLLLAIGLFIMVPSTLIAPSSSTVGHSSEPPPVKLVDTAQTTSKTTSETTVQPTTETAQPMVQPTVEPTTQKLTIRPEASYPGDVVLVIAPQTGIIKFNGNSYPLSESETGNITFLPVPVDQSPGEISVRWIQENKSNPQQVTLVVKDKEFSTQYLKVTKKQEEMRKDSKKVAEDRKKVNEALSHPVKQPLFSGEFLQPLEGRVSTMYGYTRYVNGVLSSRHMAIDIAAPEGTPIIAPNDGEVVLADLLYLSGNRVILDHGSHLYSSFSHMSKLNVKSGQKVQKGDTIGWVGSTGFSTGPHLHHAFYAHGSAVNPTLFFGTDPTKW